MNEQYRDIGRFRLLNVIGRDAVGEIHRAEMLGTVDYVKHVSVKILHHHLTGDPENLRTLFAEADQAARLQNSKIVSVYEARHKQGLSYLAVEHVPGWTLRGLIELCRTSGRRFPVPAAAFVVSELCVALRYLQGQTEPRVHGAISPEYIHISRTGRVKLGDYCTAHFLARAVGDPRELPDELLPYLAPEQASGAAATSRTDVYALGLILFELLTGCRLNSGETRDEIVSEAARPAELVPSNIVDDVASLDDAVRVALQHDPAARSSADGLHGRLAIFLSRHEFDSASMAEFGAAVEHFSSQRARAIEASSKSPPPSTSSRLRRGSKASPAASPAAPVLDVPVPRVMVARAPVADDEAPTEMVRVIRKRSPWLVLASASVVLLAVAIGAYYLYGRSTSLGDERSDGLSGDVDEERDTAASSPIASTRSPSVDDDTTTLSVRSEQVARAPDPDFEPRRVAVTSPAVAKRAVATESERVPAVVEPDPTIVAQLDQAVVRERAATEAQPTPTPSSPSPREGARPGGADSLSAGAGESAVSADVPVERESIEDVLRRKEVHQLLRQAKQRGLHPGDDPVFDRLRRQVSRAQDGDRTEALRQLRIVVEDFVIDQSFIERKLSRFRSAMQRARGLRAARMQQDYVNIQELINGGALAQASMLISTLLGRQPRSLTGSSGARLP